MNYIKHMNAFFTLVKQDTRLKSTHISLYMALFQYWNFNRFQNPFPVYRDNIMKLSKIGSKNTYHECMKELHEAKYIYYHPSASRFLPVKVSIGRLDIEEEPASRYKQLDIFKSSEEQSLNPTPDLPCPKIGTDETGQNLENTCPKFDTDSVPYLTATCPKNDTVPVPKMGHNIKLNISKTKTVCNTPTKIFGKNEKLSEAVNKLGAVPKSVHGVPPSAYGEGKGVRLFEVIEFFTQNNYPHTEAQKFFYYNQGRGWMLKDKVPIKDWQSLGHKWMLGISKKSDAEASYEDKSSPSGGGFRRGPAPDAQELFKRFTQGQKIFKLITGEHFDQLQLQLDDAVMLAARKERINQLTGSNQNAILQLLQAYQTNKENDPLLIKDQESLNALARRIAVIHHFHQQKQSGSEIP